MSLLIKQIVVFLASQLIKLLWLFPIKKKRILFLSFDGKQFSDSPKYIYDEMLKIQDSYELIWAFNKSFDIKKYTGVNYVVKGKFRYFYLFCTSKFIVVNDSTNLYMPVRRNQIFLNTWHGGGWFKKVGLSCENAKKETIYEFKQKNKQHTYYVASSEYFVETVLSRSFGYEGKILRTGMPRNAIFYKDNVSLHDRVRSQFLGENNNTLLVLYAPTYRNYKDEIPAINIDMLTSSLKQRFNREVLVLYRAHHLIGTFDLSLKKVINVTDYPDMQELLLASDIIMSDYSSCMWEAAIQYKPIIVYAPDAQKYIKTQGFFLDFDKWPFIVGQSNEELAQKILRFDEEKYNTNIRELVADTMPYENANAIKAIIDLITLT